MPATPFRAQPLPLETMPTMVFTPPCAQPRRGSGGSE